MSMSLDEAKTIATGHSTHATVTLDCAEAVLHRANCLTLAAKVAAQAAAQRANDAKPLIVDPRGALGTALLRNKPRGAYPGITFED